MISTKQGWTVMWRLKPKNKKPKKKTWKVTKLKTNVHQTSLCETNWISGSAYQWRNSSFVSNQEPLWRRACFTWSFYWIPSLSSTLVKLAINCHSLSVQITNWSHSKSFWKVFKMSLTWNNISSRWLSLQ